MNYYTQLLYKIKELGEANDYVNTIVHGKPSEKDLSKKTIFPLLNVSIDGAQFTNGRTVILNTTIQCVTIRDIVKHEPDQDKIFGIDNEVDNMNTTLAVLNDIWNSLERDLTDSGIRALDNPSLEAIVYEGDNLLDGWSLTVDIEFPNTDLAVC